MSKKKKISLASKSQKTDMALNNEINKIIEVTEEQNLAINKILTSKNNILKQTEEA
jgi:hypothetical protein